MEIEVDLSSKTTTENRKIMLEVVKKDASFFDYASDELKNDYDFNFEAVKANPKVYYYINANFKNDKPIVLIAANPKNNKFVVAMYVRDQLAYYNIDEKLRDDEEVITKCIEADSYNFQYASKRLRSDKKFAIKAIKLGASIEDTIGLMNDKEVLFTAAKNHQSPSEFTIKRYPKKIFNDKKYISLIVQGNNSYKAVWLLKQMNSKFLKDREIASLATQSDSSAFYVFSKFKKDQKMVLEAVKRDKGEDPYSFRYADSSLKNNKSFVEKVVSIDGNSILYANKKFIKNRQLVFSAIANGLENFDNEIFKIYSKDTEFINKVFKINYSFFPHVDKKFKLDRDLTINAIKYNYASNFKHIHKKFKNDEEIVFVGLTTFFDEQIIKQVDKKFFSNEKFIKRVLKKLSDDKNDHWINRYYDEEDKSIFWKYVNKKFKKTKSFVIDVCNINIDYKGIFDMNDFYKNKKYDKDIYDLFINNQPIIRMRSDGEIIVKDKDTLKVKINLINGTN
jgi:hypothetical protein|tara:strand:- start:20 stop:1537 length:1518 start_codon:yes stop_codon:yes gene_type:complete